MATFLGLSRCEFTNKETGELITGWHVWLAEPATAPSVGVIPVKKWVPEVDYPALIESLGGPAVLAKYAGKEVQVVLSLTGRLRGLSFPSK